jgi:hypothetical protein
LSSVINGEISIPVAGEPVFEGYKFEISATPVLGAVDEPASPAFCKNVTDESKISNNVTLD